MYVANNSSILQYCHGMLIEGVLIFYCTTEYANSWGGGLTARRKRKSSLLRPPPLFFLEVGRKKGGRNSGAVRYNLFAKGDYVFCMLYPFTHYNYVIRSSYIRNRLHHNIMCSVNVSVHYFCRRGEILFVGLAGVVHMYYGRRSFVECRNLCEGYLRYRTTSWLGC